MLTKVSSKGQTVIPLAIREQAGIQAGDEMDVGLSGGLIVLRKRKALTAERVRKMLRQGKSLPEMTESNEDEVAMALERIRRRARL